MEQEAVLCAKFILDLNQDGYYVNPDVLASAKNIVNDYVSENDCDMGEYDDEENIY